jgi:hypothetical protein
MFAAKGARSRRFEDWKGFNKKQPNCEATKLAKINIMMIYLVDFDRRCIILSPGG